jgi:hypothetical protein
MLYSIDRGDIVRSVPHADTFKLWKSRLNATEIKAVKFELNRRVDGGEIHTSSWMPGRDWTGTVFQPIWEKACLKNVDEAAKCFGLFLWEVMMERPETWAFGRYKLNEIKIEGMTYFRVDMP